jgi:Zn-dependent protease with chaperone function
VLAHEAGHVIGRHGLRQVLQNSMTTLFVLYATGDASSLGVALPVVLVQAGYSREFEAEADRFALDLLRARYRQRSLRRHSAQAGCGAPGRGGRGGRRGS